MIHKIIYILSTLLIIILTPAQSLAAMPDITAGSKEFDFFNGCYVFKDKVTVNDRGRIVTAQKAVAQIATQKIWASGGVTLEGEGINFKCNKIFVQGLKHSVDVIGSVDFLQSDALKINCDVGTFSWDSKIADFYGHVKISFVENSTVSLDSKLKSSLKKINGSTYDHIQYNVVEKKIIRLDKRFKSIPKAEFSEPDPTED